jgi:dTDP-4-amino-4,6-dideoxygalactose transaminase
VVVDVSDDDYGLDPKLEVRSPDRARFLMPVHLYGNSRTCAA